MDLLSGKKVWMNRVREDPIDIEDLGKQRENPTKREGLKMG